MTKWIVAAIAFGIFAAMFVLGALSSASSVYDHGVQSVVMTFGLAFVLRRQAATLGVWLAYWSWTRGRQVPAFT